MEEKLLPERQTNISIFDIFYGQKTTKDLLKKSKRNSLVWQLEDLKLGNKWKLKPIGILEKKVTYFLHADVWEYREIVSQFP
jgi:hypothetical protein